MARVLIVDDDADLAEVLAQVLRAEGHAVQTATSARDGLHQLEASLPDAVVLDVEMPGLDGPAMAGEMQRQKHGREAVPIVLASGVADLQRVARRVGTPYYISKMFQVGELLGVLRRALEERRPPRPGPSPVRNNHYPA